MKDRHCLGVHETMNSPKRLVGFTRRDAIWEINLNQIFSKTQKQKKELLLPPGDMKLKLGALGLFFFLFPLGKLTISSFLGLHYFFFGVSTCSLPLYSKDVKFYRYKKFILEECYLLIKLKSNLLEFIRNMETAVKEKKNLPWGTHSGFS